MKIVTLDALSRVAANSRDGLWAAARSVGLDSPKLILHWSAGHYYDQFFPDDYHIEIDGSGAIYLSTDDLSEVLEHTWHLNTGTVGISLCCAADATTNDLGDEPPTEEQIEIMAQIIAVLCADLWLTISPENVLTHGEAADSTDLYDEDDLYGPESDALERWDLQFLGTPESPEYIADHSDPRTGGNVIRAKAQYYQHKFNTEAARV